MNYNKEQKNIRTWGYVQHLLENLLKMFPLTLIEFTGRNKNAIRPKFSSYKYTVNNKNKVVISSKKQYRMHLRYPNKKNPWTHTNTQKKPIAVRQVFVSIGVLEPDSKFMNEIIEWKRDYKTIPCV